MSAQTTIAEHFEAILERVSNGEFTRPVLRELGIPKRAFYHWLEARPDKAKVYQDAKDDGEEMVITDCIAISDEVTPDVQRSKLRVDTRLKALAKFNPKRWGERVALDHGGTLRVGAAEDLTDAELARIAAGGSAGTALPPPSTD